MKIDCTFFAGLEKEVVRYNVLEANQFWCFFVENYKYISHQAGIYIETEEGIDSCIN